VLDFPPIIQERDILSTHALLDSEVFSAKDCQDAMRRLIDSKTGYYSYDKLCIELGKGDGLAGKKTMSALIEWGVLDFRPTSKLARDLIPAPQCKVVTATGEPALRAMELIISELDASEKKKDK
jgi:hypothetical protein